MSSSGQRLVMTSRDEIELARLSAALGDWTARPGPAYLRLADALADAIAEGHLGLGSRLPAERVLAGHMRLARGTVVAAYETLRSRGIVHTRRGSGTIVDTRAVRAKAHRAPLLSRLLGGTQVPIDMAIGALMLAPEDLDGQLVGLADAARLAPAHGYAPLGLPSLREAIAVRFSARGIPTAPDQILITTGGQNALSLLASGLLIPGAQVVTESPTYPAAIEVFVRSGARVIGVERDHAGPLIGDLESLMTDLSVRMLYLIPTSHNPTGGIMSEARRHAVVRLAQEHRALIVEDAVLEDLAFSPRIPPALARLDPDRVLSVGSLSKTIWGGLRVGWIRGPSEVILRLGRLRASYDLGSPLLEQTLALSLLARYDEILEGRVHLARSRVEYLCDQLHTHLPDWSFDPPKGGLCVWVRLPGVSGDAFAQVALRHGVALTPGRTASPEESYLPYVRLSAGAPPDQLREGVVRLVHAWNEATSMDALSRDATLPNTLRP